MKNWQEKILYSFLLLLLSIYPTYSAVFYGLSSHQLKHHIDFLKGTSDYFNPWQYRVLSPVLVEAVHQIFTFTLYKIITINDTYETTFIIFRTGQHLLILISAWYLYSYFTNNKPLRLLMLILLSGGFAVAANGSDFAFNTYFDILFYTWGAYIIFAKKNYALFLPLTLLAALNRETSLLLPFLLLIDFKLIPDKKPLWNRGAIFIYCLIIYAIIFVGIRTFYGYQPPAPIGKETGPTMFFYNLTDPITLFWLFSLLSIFPVYIFFNLRILERRLYVLFCLIVPLWFTLHFFLVWAKEVRLFVVPLTIVFIPIMLSLIQNSFEKFEPKRNT